MNTTYDRALSMLAREPDLCREIARVMSSRGVANISRRPMSMTRRMRDLYQFIRSYTEANEGVAPSFDEMMERMDLRSKSGVHRLLCALEERGMIRRLPNRARAIVCIEQEIVREAA